MILRARKIQYSITIVRKAVTNLERSNFACEYNVLIIIVRKAWSLTYERSRQDRQLGRCGPRTFATSEPELQSPLQSSSQIVFRFLPTMST